MSLRKEMFVAIFLGLLLGGSVAFVLVKMPNFSLTKNTGPTPTPVEVDKEDTSPTQFIKEPLTLDILLPENQSFSQDEEMTISGKTKPGAVVSISAPIDEVVATAGDDGAFSERITLEEGSNEILIVGNQGTETVEKRIIINYTKETI